LPDTLTKGNAAVVCANEAVALKTNKMRKIGKNDRVMSIVFCVQKSVKLNCTLQ
jgi:hypothetical protein